MTHTANVACTSEGSNTLWIFLGQQATYSVHLRAANSVYAHTSAFCQAIRHVQEEQGHMFIV